jgi:hyperosmotically inducible periplasmic protein
MTSTFLASFGRRIAPVIGAALLGLLIGCTGAGVKTGQYIDDSAITAKVKTQMATSEDVRARSVHVETVNGEVRLSGFVQSDGEKRRAGEIARSVAGVRSVSNALVVRPE